MFAVEIDGNPMVFLITDIQQNGKSVKDAYIMDPEMENELEIVSPVYSSYPSVNCFGYDEDIKEVFMYLGNINHSQL